MKGSIKIGFIGLLLVLVSSIHGQNVNAQSETEQISETINLYIEGTAYGYPEKLREAFIPGANMFLDHSDKPLYTMTIEEYAERLAKHSERGKFNGRTTNILSIDRFQGIAMTKLEVLIPSYGRRFIDMLLLKKLNNGWKIISKTAGSELSKRKGDKVLIVTSNVSHKENTDFSTGNSFSEVSIAYFEYQNSGYHVDFISPNGGEIPLAYIDPNDSVHTSALFDPDFMYAISHTKRPSEIDPDEYDIILYTGGSAPIFDIPQNIEIQNIAAHIYEQNKGVIAAVCHGTAGIVNIKMSDGSYLVEGRNVNGYPEAFENKESKLYKSFPFIIENKIQKNGGNFKHGEKAREFHIIDGRLVTGQNFLSSRVVAQKSMEVSRKHKTKK
ncbi:MAG: nuclear transport factor 2 family protein [Flavobacteriaceae bacterium]